MNRLNRFERLTVIGAILIGCCWLIYHFVFDQVQINPVTFEKIQNGMTLREVRQVINGEIGNYAADRFHCTVGTISFYKSPSKIVTVCITYCKTTTATIMLMLDSNWIVIDKLYCQDPDIDQCERQMLKQFIKANSLYITSEQAEEAQIEKKQECEKIKDD